MIVFVPLLITWGDLEFTFWLSAAHLLSSILVLYEPDLEKAPDDGFTYRGQLGILNRLKMSPAQIVALSFFGLIFAGAFVLKLPVSAREGVTVPFIDCLFVSTSAVCVTGLSTISIGNSFSYFGQFVILILIQVGGLSIMTFYSSIAILLGKSMPMKDRIMMQDLLEVSSLEDLLSVVIDIMKYTFVIELWGTVILSIGFMVEGENFGMAIYYGFFHSVSAFCNAGFSVFDTNLENYATNPLIHGTVAVLIILGGLGFIVLKEVTEVIVKRRSFVRMTLHSKTVIVTTIALVVAGTLFIFFSEFLHALDKFSVIDKFQIAFFQSVTSRTAGYDTIPMASLNSYTLYVIVMLMFIGASPGSTGGGIKTTTFAILVQSIRATLRGRKTITMFDRTISSTISLKATALSVISLAVVCFFILLMMKVEPNQSFLSLTFEVISAFGTVGLSMGITPFLSVIGKAIICMVMFIGRVGPLTLVLAIGERGREGFVEHPEGRIMIG